MARLSCGLNDVQNVNAANGACDYVSAAEREREFEEREQSVERSYRSRCVC